MDYKLELVVVPVSDVDRAEEFYVEKLGFNGDVKPQGWGRLPRGAAHAPGIGVLDHRRDQDQPVRARDF